MTNEMKLLRAFIEAQGYEIEATHGSGVYCGCIGLTAGGCHKCQGTGMLPGIIDYKVTKRPCAIDYDYSKKLVSEYEHNAFMTANLTKTVE